MSGTLLHTVSTLHGTPWASPTRVAGYARARGRAAGAAPGLDARACARSGRASLTSVPAHDPRIPQRGATRTKIGPPRRARVDARDARERTSHGPRSASSASAAARGGRSGRLGRVRPRARLRVGLPRKKFQNLSSIP